MGDKLLDPLNTGAVESGPLGWNWWDAGKRGQQKPNKKQIEEKLQAQRDDENLALITNAMFQKYFINPVMGLMPRSSQAQTRFGEGGNDAILSGRTKSRNTGAGSPFGPGANSALPPMAPAQNDRNPLTAWLQQMMGSR